MQPISVTVDQANGGSLNFGKIAAIAGTVVVNANTGAYSSSPNMIVDASNIQRAHFNVSGEAGLAYTTSLPSSTDPVTLNDGNGGTMSADLTLSSNVGHTIGDSGFWVGGTLSVADGQQVGTYQGTFDVTVQYN